MPMRIGTGAPMLSAYNLPLAPPRSGARHGGAVGRCIQVPERPRDALRFASRLTANMRTTFTFRSAGNLLFRRHAVRELAGVLDRIGAKRVFVVTDQILARVGIVDQVKEAAGRPLEGFDGGGPGRALGKVRD